MALTLPISNALSDNVCASFSNSTTGSTSLHSCLATGTIVPIVDNIVSTPCTHPSSVQQALELPHWKIVMEAEYSTLVRNARLVAKGFQQHAGVDFSDTFSPVVKASTIQIIFTLVVAYNWNIHQIDINYAFLNGILHKDVYMCQPEGFVSSSHPIHALTSRSALKTLGSISYFLGFEAFRDNFGLYLNQAKYIFDLLVKINMVHAKPSSTPMALGQKLVLEDSTHFPDVTLYHSTIGALQYLTLTWPNISFSINKLSQFLKAPTQHHWSAYKRLLRYVSGTRTLGLSFRPIAQFTLEGFSDADWACNVDDGRSMIGYCVFLGGNLVTWNSHKQQVVTRTGTIPLHLVNDVPPVKGKLTGKASTGLLGEFKYS
ncbi:Retrovirus-related Pol polyprotein from transposon RE2 [Vitis vinifera]|uniref:Retrovirus-related Pol polyprotein from transposon RE2 n=1 Tax=Vitis vinifera TaxID=29760 RepID=A0A438JAL6_VITVI|nr:Retrovirus-related Pol polyprotein from transposon RE2 [Vitis vinifera]